MTIRRRYYLSLLMVLALFGANLFAYFWSARIRHYAESEWDKATASELKLSSIRQELDNLNKHFVLASQIRQEDSTAVGATETRQHADDHAEHDAEHHHQQIERLDHDRKAVKQIGNLFHYARPQIGARPPQRRVIRGFPAFAFPDC